MAGAFLAMSLGAVPWQATPPPVPEPSRVTRVLELEAMTAVAAVALWLEVSGPIEGASAAPGPHARTLILQDTPRRIERFEGLLALLDVPAQTELRIYVRPVVHRLASELAALVKETFGTRIAAAVPLDPSDTLVVRAPWEVYQEIDRFLRRLDRP